VPQSGQACDQPPIDLLVGTSTTSAAGSQHSSELMFLPPMFVDVKTTSALGKKFVALELAPNLRSSNFWHTCVRRPLLVATCQPIKLRCRAKI